VPVICDGSRQGAGPATSFQPRPHEEDRSLLPGAWPQALGPCLPCALRETRPPPKMSQGERTQRPFRGDAEYAHPRGQSGQCCTAPPRPSAIPQRPPRFPGVLRPRRHRRGRWSRDGSSRDGRDCQARLQKHLRRGRALVVRRGRVHCGDVVLGADTAGAVPFCAHVAGCELIGPPRPRTHASQW
jgi:hypothetical protein